MVRIHASVSAILMGLCLLGGSPVLAQSTTVQQVPQRQVEPVLPPEYKPDLVVTSAKATTVCTAQGTVTAKIVAVVKNQSPKGTADLSNIPWQIVIEVTKWWSTSGPGFLENPSKQTIKPQLGGPKTLKPGQSWTATLSIVGIPKFKKGGTKPRNYGFVVRVDPVKGVPEANEANNEFLTYALDPCFKP